MKKITASLLLVIAIFLLASCSVQENMISYLSTIFSKQYWDFIGYAQIDAKGDPYAYQRKLLEAKDVAIAEAYALAAKTVYGFHISENITVQNYALEKRLETELDTFVHGAHLIGWYEDRDKLMVIAVVRIYKKDLSKLLNRKILEQTATYYDTTKNEIEEIYHKMLGK